MEEILKRVILENQEIIAACLRTWFLTFCTENRQNCFITKLPTTSKLIFLWWKGSQKN